MSVSIDESLEKIASYVKIIASSYTKYKGDENDGNDDFCEWGDDVLYRYLKFIKSYNGMRRFEAISHLLIIGYEMKLIQIYKQFINPDRYDEKIFDFWNTTTQNVINYIDTKGNPKGIEIFIQSIANDTDMFNRMVYMFELEDQITPIHIDKEE